MSKRDFYETLGVDRDCSDEQLKKAHRRLAMKYHPDRRQDESGAEQKLKEVNEAFDVLSDRQKRGMYDQFGHDAPNAAGAGGWSGFSAENGAQMGDIFGDIFGNFFGQDKADFGSRHQSGGRNLQMRMAIDLIDVANGLSRTVKANCQVVCKSCNGSGSKDASKPTTCVQCAGDGMIRARQGFFSVNTTCPNCRGSGKIISNPCKSCNGDGRVAGDREIKIDIPPGVDTGTQLRLRGQGEPGTGNSPPGDLLIVTEVRKHSLFAREGVNLYADLPITVSEAALGGDKTVPSLSGKKVRLKLKPGIQHGTLLKIKGQGLPALKSRGKGDLYYRAQIEIPIAISKEQRRLLEQLKNLETAATQPLQKQWQKKTQQYF